MESCFGSQKDIFFMKKALKQAHVAYGKEEVPVGAVVVDEDSTIVARAHNKTELLHTQSGHAELLALAQAGKKKKDWRLEGCWLYITLEPCAMCMHMIYLTRLAGVVYGTSSPLFGGQLDKVNRFAVYKKDVVRIVKDVCADESRILLQEFFKKRRRNESGRSKKGTS